MRSGIFSVSQHLFNLMNDHLTNVFLPHHILAIVLLSTTLSGDSLSVTSVVELEGIRLKWYIIDFYI